MTDKSSVALREFIASRALLRGSFTLRSGGTSDVFLDCKMVSSNPAFLRLACPALLDTLVGLEFDSIVAAGVGAIPLATALAIYSTAIGSVCVQAGFVRDEVKDHGTRKLVEGDVLRGTRAVVIEDVVTTGQCAFRACAILTEQLDAEIVAVRCLIDRGETPNKLLSPLGPGGFRGLFRLEDVLPTSQPGASYGPSPLRSHYGVHVKPLSGKEREDG